MSLFKKLAFTMVEVLIVLGVIGIVAAITLPNLITNIEKQKNLSILKKAYAEISNHLKMFDYEYGCDGDLRQCAPGHFSFVDKFVHYLYTKQHFGSPIDVKGYKWYLTTSTSDITSGSNPVIADPNYASDKNNSGGRSYLLSSRGGEYYIYIGPYMYDNWYSINAKKYGYFRARIFIYTNPKHISICKSICNDADRSRARVKDGLEMFELFITDTERIIPQGFSECGNHYYCKSLTSDNCSSETKNYTACLQKIIQDGWKINY